MLQCTVTYTKVKMQVVTFKFHAKKKPTGEVETNLVKYRQ